MDNLSLIQSYLKKKKISVTNLVKKMGIGRNTFYYQIAKEFPDDDFANKFKDATGDALSDIISTNELIQPSYLLNESRSSYNKIPKSNALEIGEIKGYEESSPFIDIGGGQYIMVVPLVPIKAQASYVAHYDDERFINENFTQKHAFPVSRVYRGKYMAFIVDGESMDNGVAGEAIPEGYTVTGREIQKHHWMNKFHIHRYKDYIIVHKDGIFIKQITKHDTENGIITCHSLNPDKDQYFDFDLNLDECYQIFNVVNVTQTK